MRCHFTIRLFRADSGAKDRTISGRTANGTDVKRPPRESGTIGSNEMPFGMFDHVLELNNESPSGTGEVHI